MFIVCIGDIMMKSTNISNDVKIIKIGSSKAVTLNENEINFIEADSAVSKELVYIDDEPVIIVRKCQKA